MKKQLWLIAIIFLTTAAYVSVEALPKKQPAAPLVSDHEKIEIDAWLARNNFNPYGDSKDMMYTGGTPLFNERTGHRTDRYEYLKRKFPKLPWSRQSRA